jgi:hypothetical protein
MLAEWPLILLYFVKVLEKERKRRRGDGDANEASGADSEAEEHHRKKSRRDKVVATCVISTEFISMNLGGILHLQSTDTRK